MTDQPAHGARRSLRELGPEAAVEGLTMALYVSLSLLAVVVARPSVPPDEAAGELAWLLLFTCLGLILAHLLAFRLSAHLVHGGSLPRESKEATGAQVIGGLAITALAIAPVVLMGTGLGVLLAEAVLLGTVVLAGWIVATRAGLSLVRRVAYVLAVIVMVVAVLAVKTVTGH
jgi:hypothetical protein